MQTFEFAGVPGHVSLESVPQSKVLRDLRRDEHRDRVETMANLVERLADSMNSLGVKRAYGDPVTLDGAEIIPVALVYFGFGGGSGQSKEGESGDGGGGGGASIPIGAYVSGFDGPTFKPNPIALLVVSIPVLFVGGRAFARVIRALKK